MCGKTVLHAFYILAILTGSPSMLFAQKDSLTGLKIDSILSNGKGIIGQLAKNLLADTLDTAAKLQGNDKIYQPYRGRIIRQVIIRPLEFGVSIGDTSKVLNNKLTRLANHLHKNTRTNKISKNLFFHQYDKLSPYLLGDNERFLRDLPYLQDARIKVLPVKGSKDSVDIWVLTKDVISVGGNLRLHNSQSASVTLREDNLRGLGDRFQLQMLYDQSRRPPIGQGFEYIRRNIGGTFIDGTAGYLNFEKAIRSRKAEERMTYIRLIKPMVHPYMRWTYALDASLRSSQNMYATDSFYNSNLRYKALFIDAWSTLNTSAGHMIGKNQDERVRTALSLRILNQHFSKIPLNYRNQYDYQYADLAAILGAVSLFKQNFYKAQYLYGFGRPEDVPQGVDASLTMGWTAKYGRKRPYLGVNFQRFYFTAAERYFNYTILLDGFLHQKHWEDVNILGRVSFIDHLHDINKKWKQRTFLNTEIATQLNSYLNEPIFSNPLYGNPDVNELQIGGDLRASINGESVFYSPWSLLYFRLAPMAFGNATLFRSRTDHAKRIELYTAIGGGLRFRNESLIFGTMDIKGWYFPGKNLNGESVRIEFTTRVRFTYDQNLIRRPGFIQVN